MSAADTSTVNAITDKGNNSTVNATANISADNNDAYRISDGDDDNAAAANHDDDVDDDDDDDHHHGKRRRGRRRRLVSRRARSC